MGRKKKPPPDDPEQSARFKEVAERILDDSAEEKFEEAMKLIVSTKRNVVDQKEND
jgi:hypothetical protein